MKIRGPIAGLWRTFPPAIWAVFALAAVGLAIAAWFLTQPGSLG